jgi:hypothetical protein
MTENILEPGKAGTGIKVSKLLHEFRGILTGNPVYYGDPRLLLDEMEPHDSGAFHKT